MSDHDICSHCDIPESSDHYFFHCTIYSNERLQLFRDSRCLHPLNCNILLFGNSAFTHSENITIVSAVYTFIKISLDVHVVFVLFLLSRSHFSLFLFLSFLYFSFLRQQKKIYISSSEIIWRLRNILNPTFILAMFITVLASLV